MSRLAIHNIKKISKTLLVFAMIFSASIVYFIFAGEIGIGTGSGVPTYNVISYASSPIKYISILFMIGFAVFILMLSRWLLLKKHQH